MEAITTMSQAQKSLEASLGAYQAQTETVKTLAAQLADRNLEAISSENVAEAIASARSMAERWESFAVAATTTSGVTADAIRGHALATSAALGRSSAAKAAAASASSGSGRAEPYPATPVLTAVAGEGENN